MLSAITASTGAGRHVDYPSVASAERDAVRDRERGHRLHQPPGPARDDEQGQHEQQMIDTRQDVLDAEREIVPGHAPKRSGAAGIDADRLLRRKPMDPGAAVSEGDAHERVREGGLQARDAQGSDRAGDRRPEAPGLDGGVARRSRRDGREGIGRAGEVAESARRRSPSIGVFHST